MVTSRSFLPIIALAAVQAPALADSLSIEATAVAVSIAPGAAGRRYVRLPGLDIDVTIDARCSNGGAPTLTLSSADTRQHFNTDSLDASIPERFSLPARQLPPLWAQDFCTVEGGPEQALSLDKKAFVSIVGSLRCGDGPESTLTSQSTVVDLEVRCEREPFDPAQEPSDNDSARNPSVRSQD